MKVCTKAGAGTQQAQEAQNLLCLLCFLCSWRRFPKSPGAADSDSRSDNDAAAQREISQDLLVIAIEHIIQPDECGDRPRKLICERRVRKGIAWIARQ